MPSLRPRLRPGASTRARVVEVRTSKLRLVRFGSTRPRFDYGTGLEPDVAAPDDLLMPVVGTSSPALPGKTLFLGLLDSETEIAVALPLPARNVIEILIYATAPAGAGQSFTYTLRKIPKDSDVGSDQAIAGSISGATNKQARLTGSVAYGAEDKFTIKLQTSASAAQAMHFAVIVTGQ